MTSTPLVRALIALTVACTLNACGSAAQKQATREVSPLAGTWTRDGDVPAPKANNPEFTRLSFKADGTLEASYVAAGGALAGVIKKAPKVMQEQDSYSIIDAKTVRITEGSSARDYAYDTHDGKLYLTAPDGGDAAIFSKTTAGSNS
jgi:hypothetical protein